MTTKPLSEAQWLAAWAEHYAEADNRVPGSFMARVAAELRRVDAAQPADHVQKPGKNEHVVDDVSKIGAESNMPARPAAPQGGAYAELPTPDLPRGGFPDLFAADKMRDFADRTHALRASHGQAPAGAAPAEAVERIVHLRADRERRVYVAGPMTGLPEYNFPLFNATAACLRAEGWHVENPAEHGHVEGAGWADYLRWDISRIATCGAIYLLPGWSKSKGATLEVHIADVLGLQVLLADGAESPTAQPAPAATPQADNQPVPMIDAEAVAYNEWFNGEQGTAYDGMWAFARAAWMARAARAPADSGVAPASGVAAGIEAAAQLLERKADDFARENGSDDLGGLSFGRGAHADAKLEYHSTLLELAEEIRSLAPTPPVQAADSVLEDAARLAKIIQAIRDYHFALDNREHGGVAMARAWNAICDVLNMDWVQGAESAARKQGGA